MSSNYQLKALNVQTSGNDTLRLPAGCPPPPLKSVSKLTKNAFVFRFTDGRKDFLAYNPTGVSAQTALEAEMQARAENAELVLLTEKNQHQAVHPGTIRNGSFQSQSTVSTIPYCLEPESLCGSRPYLLSTPATSVRPPPNGYFDCSAMRPMRILSIDGGGVRGRSVLEILGRQLKDAGFSENVKPCEVFDLIGGTSTGGLVALLLGRLGCTIPEATEIYEEVSKEVFKSRKIVQMGRLITRRERFSSKAFKRVMERVAEKYGKKDMLLENPEAGAVKT